MKHDIKETRHVGPDDGQERDQRHPLRRHDGVYSLFYPLAYSLNRIILHCDELLTTKNLLNIVAL